MDAVMSGISTVFAIVETAMTAILGNTVLAVIFSAGFVSLGLRMFRKLVRSSKALS